MWIILLEKIILKLINKLETENILRIMYSKLNRVDLFNFYSLIDDILYQQNFDFFDKLILVVNVSKISPAVMIGMLRTSFIYRKKLKNWEIFKIQCLEELTFRNVDNKLLIDFNTK